MVLETSVAKSKIESTSFHQWKCYQIFEKTDYIATVWKKILNHQNIGCKLLHKEEKSWISKYLKPDHFWISESNPAFYCTVYMLYRLVRFLWVNWSRDFNAGLKTLWSRPTLEQEIFWIRNFAYVLLYHSLLKPLTYYVIGLKYTNQPIFC